MESQKQQLSETGVTFGQLLTKAILLKRYMRFLADVTLPDGSTTTVHCPNTGSMKTCYEVGAPVYLSHHSVATRKLAYTWEYSELTGGLIGVNTAMPNKVVEWAIRRGLIPELRGYTEIRGEAKYGKNSRIDVLLDGHLKLPRCYVEVKNTTLLVDRSVQFPDAVTERGLKHLIELQEMVKAGHRAVMLFFVNRPDGEWFAPADHIDPGYGKELRRAAKNGVEIMAWRAKPGLEEVSLGGKVDVRL